ncbi:MAG: gliding motility-associated C-terminal domain-containing protein [Saprospiraceae bacterium]
MPRLFLVSLIGLGFLLPLFDKLVESSPRFLAVEVCDNARDDDGDGLIDLNDPDCSCPEAKPISLIPNPSFEEMNCCPSTRSQLNCAKTWIQASEATTDYLHLCGWFGWDHLPPPQPIPDGRAVVGFRNGRFGMGNVQPGWKEYTGACLTAPLRAGFSYRFEFYIGFINTQVSPPLNVVFYGSTDCNNLPFGEGNPDYGCPTNGPGWKELGRAFVSGVNNWVKVNLTAKPTEDIYAIAIGPDCINVSAIGDIYYFFDNLILADSKAFEFEITAKAHPCADNFTLQVPDYDTLQYQWYKNGIALVGEKNAVLNVKTGDGNYVARIVGPNSCRLTRAYTHRIPAYTSQMDVVICKDDVYNFHNQRITKSGTYKTTLKTAENCDSVVQLNLRIADEEYDTVYAKIFEGEYFHVGPYKYNIEGTRNITLQSVYGCDSLVFLDLQYYKIFKPTAFSPNGDGNNDSFMIFGGSDLKQITQLQIFNRWGDLVFQRQDLEPNNPNAGWDGEFKGNPAPNGVYVYIAKLLMNDGIERQFSGAFTLIR